MRRKIAVSQFNLAEHQRSVYEIVPEAGTTFEEILHPDYWAHVAKHLRPWCRIEIRYDAADSAYFAELVVRAADHITAKVAVLRKIDLRGDASAPAAEAPEGYVVKERGKNGWCVLRGTEVVKTGFQTREQALAAAAAHAEVFAG